MKLRLSWKFLLPFRRKPRLLASAETEVVKAEENSLVEPPIDAQPEPATVVDTTSDTPAPLPPATIPRALPPPAYPDDWMRARAMYFAPATYSPSPNVERMLAPDLLYRLGTDSRRVIAEARAPAQAEPVPTPTPPPKRLPRLIDIFSTSAETEAQPDPSGRVLSVDPLLLTLFLSSREDAPEVPPEATSEYLTEPALLAHGIELRDRVVQNWTAGGPPLGSLDFYQAARKIMPHAGTALLLCHNVAKAFARGGEAIRWQAANRARAEYSDGKTTHIAALLHRDGSLKTGPFASPSIFYVLFSSVDFGATDPGDYYRFFAAATITWYAATKQTRVPIVPPSHAAEQLAQSMVDKARQIADPHVELTPAYRGWLWADALSLSERGARFGLREAGEEPNPAWIMHSAALASELHFSRSTIAQILATASPHIRRDFAGASFTLVCTVEEGTACRFATSGWADRSLEPLAAEIIDELGWKAVEQSARRQVVVRCVIPGSDPAKASCEGDRGGGFQSMKLT